MEYKFKVNQSRERSATQIATIINNQIILDILCENKRNGLCIKIETTEITSEYFEAKKDGMLKFLSLLKDKLIIKDDIENIINSLKAL